MKRTIKHAIIVSHPDHNSFALSVAIRYAETVLALGHEALVRDLYRLGFDPVLRTEERRGTPASAVTREWAALGKPDVFVLVYPIWFGGPPAILKGYIDRVFGAGRSRGLGGEGGAGELLAGKHLLSLTSSGSRRTWLDEKGVLSSLRTVYDRYFAEVFGFAETHHYHLESVTPDITAQEVGAHFAKVEEAARDVTRRILGGPPDRDPNRH